MDLKEVTLSTALDIFKYLNNNFNKGFPERNFYGEAFTALSGVIIDNNFNPEEYITSYLEKDFEDPEFHWEFNLYAWQEYLRYQDHKHIHKLVENIKFQKIFYRKVTNWVLLRALVRVRSNKTINRYLGISQALFVLLVNRYDGYITDNTLRMFYRKKSSISSQYHAFSTMLAGELYYATKINFFKERFVNSLIVASTDIKNSDEINSYGRGEKQIFGFGALLYGLSIGYMVTANKMFLKHFKVLLDYLLSYKQSDGYLPLVLSKSNSDKYVHEYNNIYDYLPFLCYCMLKSYNCLDRQS